MGFAEGYLNEQLTPLKNMIDYTFMKQGYKLEFTLPSRRWKGAVANIVPDDNSRVCGVIWELSTEDLPSLDRL